MEKNKHRARAGGETKPGHKREVRSMHSGVGPFQEPVVLSRCSLLSKLQPLHHTVP